MSLSQTINMSLNGMKMRAIETQIASSNILNAREEGYSKKTLIQVPVISAGFGLGAEISEIKRDVDLSLVRSVNASTSDREYHDIKAEHLERILSFLGSVDGQNDISFVLGEFANAFAKASNDPTSVSLRSLVVQSAMNLTGRLTNIVNDVQDMRAEVDYELEGYIDRAKLVIENTHQVNKEIRAKTGIPGLFTNDLEDKRDNLLRELSSIMHIQILPRQTGDYFIGTATGQALVNVEPIALTYERFFGAMNPHVSYENGDFENIAVSGINITEKLKSGIAKGFVELRDTILPTVQNQIDMLVEKIRDTVNALHNEGSSFSNDETLTGTRSLGSTAADAALEILSWSGTVRLATVGSNGNFDQIVDIDLDDPSLVSIDNLMTQINTSFGYDVASIDDDGHMVLNAGSGKGMAIGSVDGAPAATINHNGNEYGFSHFFGFHDLFLTGTNVSGDDNIGITQMLSVNPKYTNNPEYLNFGILNSSIAANPSGSPQQRLAVTSGDSMNAIRISNSINKDTQTFDPVGGLGSQTTTLTKYAAYFTAYHAGKMFDEKKSTTFYEFINHEAKQRLYNQSGVNIDEEVQSLTVIQLSYKASAHCHTVAKEMFEHLLRAFTR
jgi:flagellar hook-associated protein 1 FlgK